MITYSKMDYKRRGAIAAIEQMSHRGQIEGRVLIDYEAEGYPQMSLRGQRRRLPASGHHRGFLAPIPVEKAAIMRKQDGGKPQPLGIWRQDHAAELARGAKLRSIRAKHGVGRPVQV